MIDTSLIHRYMWAGRKDKNWYEDCSECFIDLFGEKDLPLVCNLFAATSINTSLKANIKLFRKAFIEYKNDLPTGNYLPNIVTQLYYIRKGMPISGRKISSFSAAMSGDPNAVVVDVWLMRAFGIGRKTKSKTGRVHNPSPSKREYDEIESWIRKESAVIGLQPRQMSAMIWSGIRIMTNGDKETHYKNILKNSLTNLFNCI